MKVTRNFYEYLRVVKLVLFCLISEFTGLTQTSLVLEVLIYRGISMVYARVEVCDIFCAMSGDDIVDMFFTCRGS